VITLRHVRMMKLRYWLLAAFGWVTLALTYLPAGTPVRVTAVYLFGLAGPGFAIAGLVVRDSAERCVLTVAISASLGVLISVAMTLLHNDSSSLPIAALAAVTTVAAILWGIRSSHETRAEPADGEVVLR
jgi:hypothetical protein